MTRQITISDEAYERLSRLKDGKKSFTQVILELTGKKYKDISDLFGAWKMSDARAEQLKREITESRTEFFSKGHSKGTHNDNV
jgi:predicted CopG family antitoxin